MDLSLAIFRLPPWAKEIMIPGGEFEELAVNCLAINATTIESIRLTSGYLLKEILDHDTKKLKSALQPDVSLWMYFAHDVTLTYVLNSLKVFTVRLFFLSNSSPFRHLKKFFSILICSNIVYRMHHVSFSNYINVAMTRTFKCFTETRHSSTLNHL